METPRNEICLNEAAKEKAVKEILKLLDGFTMAESKEILSVTEYYLPTVAKINFSLAE